MNTIIVGIGHKARHGKDSAARFIHEAFPADTKLYSFAAALRAVCRTVLGMEEKDGPLLQLVGTEVFRLMPGTQEREVPILAHMDELREMGRSGQANVLNGLSHLVGNDPDVWVRSVKHLIAEDSPRIAIITDMRFPNEVAITDETLKVTRLVPAVITGLPPASPYTQPLTIPYVAPDRPADHPSETALDSYEDWSEEISALDGDMKGLRRTALTAFNQLMLKRGILL